nr:hypothetical protein [Myxococcota bacterium]
ALHDAEAAHAGSPLHATATSVVAALLTADTADRADITVAHLGTARCYRARGDELALLTEPQSVLRALGVSDDDEPLAASSGLAPAALEPDVELHELRSDDLLLVVSDPLRAALQTRALKSLLRARASCRELLDAIGTWAAADEVAGGVIAVRIYAPTPVLLPPEPRTRRIGESEPPPEM